MGGGGGDVDMSARLLHLESEVTAKKGEITILKEQVTTFCFRLCSLFFSFYILIDR